MQKQPDKQRIVSVDMGLRNLSYSFLEYDYGNPDKIKVHGWKKLDLISMGSDLADRQNNFSVPACATIAHSLCSMFTSEFKPTTILLEQQRYRTGGSNAVQEWTIRVNLLEAMMYATLYTLNQSQGSNVSVRSVSPKQVSLYLMATEETYQEYLQTTLEKSTSKKKIATDIKPYNVSLNKPELKAAKIQLMRSWIEDPAKANLEFLDQALETSAYFKPKDKKRKFSRKAPKLDDYADSLIQGYTWIAWGNALRQYEKEYQFK